MEGHESQISEESANAANQGKEGKTTNHLPSSLTRIGLSALLGVASLSAPHTASAEEDMDVLTDNHESRDASAAEQAVLDWIELHPNRFSGRMDFSKKEFIRKGDQRFDFAFHLIADPDPDGRIQHRGALFFLDEVDNFSLEAHIMHIVTIVSFPGFLVGLTEDGRAVGVVKTQEPLVG